MEWLDKAFLQNVLRIYKLDSTIEVSSFNFAIESDAFLSQMNRVKIEFTSSKSQSEVLNVIIKTKPLGEGFNATVVGAGPLFENEMRMYKETIPAINQLFKRSGMEFDLGPELIYAADKPFPIIILKDLAPDGYSSPNQPPDAFDDSKKIIRKLAKFHAASFFLAENNECDFSDFNHSLFQSPEVVRGFFDKPLTTFREVVGSWTGCEHYLPKLEEFSQNIGTIGRGTYTARKRGQGFNVLNHGDFHEGNILIKNDSDNRLESLRFIDFQLSIYCSPSVDLIFMFDLVKRDENGELPTQDLIRFYHDEFVSALKAFGFTKPTPTLNELNEELSKDGPLQVLRSIFIIPTIFSDQVEKPEGETRDYYMKLLFNLPKCKMIFQKLLMSWVEKGWL